jgi:transposase-like protein
VRLIRPKRLPQGVLDAGVALVERKLSNSTVSDLVSISDEDWHVACRRFNATQQLAKHRGRLQARVASIAEMFGVTDRTVRRWLAIYRKNPDILALLPKPRGQRVGTRRLRPDIERLLNDVMDVWAAKAEQLPIAWILEECKRRTPIAKPCVDRAPTGHAESRSSKPCQQWVPVANSIDLKAVSPDLSGLGRQKINYKTFRVFHERWRSTTN